MRKKTRSKVHFRRNSIKHKSKNKCKSKNKIRNKSKRKQRGGFINLKRVFNSGIEQRKQNQKNTSFLCKEQDNGIEYYIEYIVPNNFVLLKNPDSVITPRFIINDVDTYVQIPEPQDPSRIKFIEYFINIRKHPDETVNGWYCMMRVYGINHGLLANLSNIMFYKIPNSWFDLNVNSINIEPSLFTLVNSEQELNVLQKMVKLHSGRIIKLKEDNRYKVIKDGTAFVILRDLRNGLIENARVKQDVLKGVADFVFKRAVGV